MIVATKHGFLLDRLVDARRTETIRKMAETLVREDAHRNEHDAIMLLMARSFKPTDVFMLLPDARAEAAQIVVGREMSNG